jgi:hypothetical protein
LTVCDTGTYQCRAPRDYDPPFFNATAENQLCAAGFTLVKFAANFPDGGTTTLPDGGDPYPDGGDYPALPDGGDNLGCLQTCQTSADCTADFTSCTPGALIDSQGNLIGACTQNFCGPELYGSNGSLLPDAGAYFGACDSHATNDGTCTPLFLDNVDQVYVGICITNGTLTAGYPCGNSLNDQPAANGADSCVLGDVCLGTGFLPGGQSVNEDAYLCVQMCDLDHPNNPTCANIGTQTTTCRAISNTPPTNSVIDFGFCN